MQEITSVAQFHALKSKPLLIIDFYAHWCGPCKAISPVFERLAEKHKSSSSITFAKVNVDEAKDVSQLCGITAMPTFQFYQKGVKSDEIRGADVQGLTRKIDTLTAMVSKATSGSGTKLGETKTFQGATPVPLGTGSLRLQVDLEKCLATNVSTRSSVKSILKPSFAGITLDSAAGPKIMIHVPFSQRVDLTSLKLTAPQDDLKHAPSKIHIGTNVASPKDLNSLAMAENVQTFSLFTDDYSKGVAELKFKEAKFQKVESLTLLIETNMSGEPEISTKIAQLDFIGKKA